MALSVLNQGYAESGLTGSTWTITHNLNVNTPVVETYDESDNRIFPANVEATNANTVNITWSASTSGRVYVV
jgi:hypothetical protein